MTHSTEYEHASDEPETGPSPINYRIHTTDGVHEVAGFVGIADNYIAVASLEGRMIWGMPLSRLNYFERIEPEPAPISNTRN